MISPISATTHYMIPLLNMVQGMERRAQVDALRFQSRIEGHLETTEELQAQKMDALKRQREESRLLSSWSSWGTASQYISSSLSVAAGLSYATPAGAALAAGGAMGLANRVMTDIGGWRYTASFFIQSDARQREIAAMLDAGISVLSAGVSLVGSSLVRTFSAATTAIQTAATASGLATQAGSALHKRNVEHLGASLKEIDAQIEATSKEMDEERLDMDKTLQTHEFALRMLAHTVAAAAA